MKDESKTREQLVQELANLRQQIADLGTSETERKLLDEALDERLRFEELISELSAAFVNLPAGKVDRELESALQRIAEFLHVDRCVLMELSPDRREFRATHTWGVDETIPRAAEPPPDSVAWAMNKILRGEILKFTRLDELPAKAAMEKEFFKTHGVKSILVVPLSVSGSVVGLLGADAFRTERSWPDALVPRLRLIGEIFANVLLHKQTTEQLNERLRFEQLLSDLSAKFVNLPSGEVDKEIENGLKQIAEFLEIERCVLSEWIKENMEVRVIHSVAVEGIPSMPPKLGFEALPWIARRFLRGEIFKFTRFEELPHEASEEREFFKTQGIKSSLIVPFSGGGSIMGVLGVDSFRAEREWPETISERLRLLGEIFANTWMRREADQKLKSAFAEIKQLKERLESENIYLREEVEIAYRHEDIIGRSDAIRAVLSQAEQVARTDSTVLIVGETGTGKELLARAIHSMSSRKGRPMVKVNCAALPSTLVESELFGREKGAFTGAVLRQVGRFEVADGSTIFLDEIGELPLDLQAKLLRVLQDGEFERLGSPKTIRVDVRVIAATNRDLSREVSEGKFRQDLYYRIKVFPVSVPPLRDRPEDIPDLVWRFVKEFGETMDKRIETISRTTMEALQRYPWPGNVRELRNVIERAMILSRGDALIVQMPEVSDSEMVPDLRLEDVERKHVLKVLERTAWRISGKSGAAELLGLKPTTLRSRMEKMGIKKPK